MNKNNKKLSNKKQKKLNKKRVTRNIRRNGMKETLDNHQVFTAREQKRAILEGIRKQQEDTLILNSESLEVEQKTETVQL